MLTFALVITLALLLIPTPFSFANTPVLAQADTGTQLVCDDVRYLMARDATPYDLNPTGTTVSDNTPIVVRFDPDVYSQFYTINVIRPDDIFGNPVASSDIVLNFSGVPDDLHLEFAIFRGMENLLDYAPVTDGKHVLTVRRDAVYTLVIRRQSIYPTMMAASGSFTLTANFPGNPDIKISNLRDDSTGSLLLQTPSLVKGLTSIPISDTVRVNTHTGSVISVGSQNGQGAQVRFEGGAVLFGRWAQQIDIVGGDLAAHGLTPDGQPRIFFLQDYGYLRELFNENLNIEDSNGTKITTDWQGIKGLWLLRDCTGIKLLDGRTFVAPTQPQARQITLTGGLNAMTMRLNSLNISQRLTAYDFVIDWRGVQPDSESNLLAGILTMPFSGNHQLALESRFITMARRTTNDSIEPDTPLDVTLADRNAVLTLDFINMANFSLTGDTISMKFTDRRAELTPVITRSATKLQRLSALNDVINIIYQDLDEQTPGEQRLMLPENDSYIEIVTPAGFPAFDSTALPEEANYAPRGLNNLGGECYPVNTTLPEANCPTNGNINPANDNLWYSVTDLRAFGGYGLDLTLTRSYNSGAINVDSPFGFGWTTEYLLDSSVPYDPTLGSRPLTPESFAAFRVGLDVTYAPRGIITLTTFSGSRHVFASQQPTYTSGELTSLTMPGWTLARDSIRSTWTLDQSDGFRYEFDRAGRILSYGYPRHNRIVRVEYPQGVINGVADSSMNSVRISDDFSARQLELYYDDHNHIIRSVLRDTTNSESFAPCIPTSQCFETIYSYENGRLDQVTYSDGQTAIYTYDDAGRLIQHHDPRAPIAPDMSYNYTEQRLVSIDVLTGQDADNDGATDVLPWLTIQTLQGDRPPDRKITIKDHLNRTREYTYTLVGHVGLREIGNGYTLLSVTSPLNRPDSQRTSEEEPQTYTWQNGLLTQIGARLIGDNEGRNSTTFR
ncbi:MAG TPA: DUF6531 domain-containing protein, partial [Phototrophicaceae bacterium]|nr:DUF6531 domain-containing protein [Phototrophicaceae bacterium]